VVAAMLPAISEARTHYTGKTPADIAMMATDVIPPATMKHTLTASSKHTRKLSHHHKSVKTAISHGKHRLHKSAKNKKV
jgi:hypothetical protein